MDAVTLKHVDKSYTSYSTEVVLTGQTRESRTRQVLKDLSLSFPVGQLTVIVGRSGWALPECWRGRRSCC